MNWRRRVEFDLATVMRATVVQRAALEDLIDHRALGCGSHNGRKRPNRRRLGTMLCERRLNFSTRAGNALRRVRTRCARS